MIISGYKYSVKFFKMILCNIIGLCICIFYLILPHYLELDQPALFNKAYVSGRYSNNTPIAHSLHGFSNYGEFLNITCNMKKYIPELGFIYYEGESVPLDKNLHYGAVPIIMAIQVYTLVLLIAIMFATINGDNLTALIYIMIAFLLATNVGNTIIILSDEANVLSMTAGNHLYNISGSIDNITFKDQFNLLNLIVFRVNNNTLIDYSFCSPEYNIGLNLQISLITTILSINGYIILFSRDFALWGCKKQDHASFD